MRRGRLGAARLRAAVGSCALAFAGSLAVAQEQPPAVDAPAAQTEAPPSSTEKSALPPLVVNAPKKAAKKKTQRATQPAKSSADTAASEGADTVIIPDGVVLGGGAVSDTGTTVFDANAVKVRTDGSGDANTFLRNVPNVQYQNERDEDPGVDGQDEIDTKPLLLSINGGRTYQNNFMLNGVRINSITGPVERSVGELSSDDGTPNADIVYGLHPQTVFVPSEFLDKATIIDSNASAKYGEFMGGVVLYDLAKPPTDRYHASVSYSRETDNMVNYVLGTKDGTNPLDRKHPEFVKNNFAVSLGAPITPDFAFIAQASQKIAETSKQKDYEYFNRTIEEDSDNKFFRFATTLKTGIGKFTFDTSYTDYSQTWEAQSFRNLDLDMQSKGLTTQIEHETALPSVTNPAIGLDGVTLVSKAYYNDSESAHYSSSNTLYGWFGVKRSKTKTATTWNTTFNATTTDEWCRSIPDSELSPTATSGNTICKDGGYGSMEQGQTDYGLQTEMSGNILLGQFKLGLEGRTIDGHRTRPEDLIYYTVFTTATAGQSFTCLPGDETCTSEQYARTRSVWEAFDATASVNAIHSFAEIDQTWKWFNVRAGVRVDYEDYFENLNLAPRLAGTFTPIGGISLTGGYNRYYEGESLLYALRDNQPRGLSYTRTYPTGEFKPPTNLTGNYNYEASDLETPYKDEYTLALRITDPLLKGQWRLRYLERYGEKEFLASDCGSNCSRMTNDGESFYRSATAEYEKFWRTSSVPLLSGAGISGSVTWSEQTTSRGTYLDNVYDPDGDGTENFILYKGQSYSYTGFKAVTGNLDIPIRIGATLTTAWFNDYLILNVNAGYNLGYEGVYDTGDEEVIKGITHDVYEDTTFDPSLMLDLSGQVYLTKNAAIEFEANNITNSAGNSVATNTNPWLRGRSYWVGSTVKF